MKILIITPWYPNRVHPQDGNFIRSQAIAAARTNEVELLCVVADPWLKQAGPQVLIDTEEGQVRVIRSHYASKGNKIQRLIRRRAAWKAAIQQQRLDPDLIHAHVMIDGGIVAQQLAGRLSVPFLVTEHSHRFLEDWPWYRLAELSLARRAARSAACLLPVSPALQEGMQKHGLRGSYQVVPNVIEANLFSPAPPDPETAFTFLHVSDFSENKNIPDLLTAFSRLVKAVPEVRLHLAGNGDHAALSSLIQSLHLRPRQILISGPHELVKVAEIMREADAFVLCSSLETQSLVLIEALLSGLPCIASDSGGPTSILSASEDGIIFPPRDIEALHQAMLKVLKQQKPTFDDRQRRSQRHHQRYGMAAQEITAIYHRLTNHKP